MKLEQLALVLIGAAACSCMICTPTPQPNPPTPFDWEPQGAALWASGTFTATVDSTIQTAGQGGNHLIVTTNISSAGLSTASDVRIAAFIRSGATLVGSSNRLITLTQGGGNDVQLNVQICPGNTPVVGKPLLVEVWAARDGDHQLLSRIDSNVTPSCAGSSCGACQ
ncbi:MAG: hypothetical protein QM817_13210 [Archangium sp.]